MFRFVLPLQIALVATVSAAEVSNFKAANGTVLPAPELNTLTCDELDVLMKTYMTSHYRDMEFIPTNHPDRPIFEYENKLATLHYQDCQVGLNHFENSAPAFSKGFN